MTSMTPRPDAPRPDAPRPDAPRPDAPRPTTPSADVRPGADADDPRQFHYLCIGCPLGCRLEVEEDDRHQIVEVRGFTCKRGEQYARQEHVEPRRTVTTTVAVRGGEWARLPVKTAGDIPKDLIAPLCDRLHQLQLEAPVAIGQVVLPDALGTGIDVVASRSLAAR